MERHSKKRLWWAAEGHLQLPPRLSPLARGRLQHPGALCILKQHSRAMVAALSMFRLRSPRPYARHTLSYECHSFRWTPTRRNPGSCRVRFNTIGSSSGRGLKDLLRSIISSLTYNFWRVPSDRFALLHEASLIPPTPMSESSHPAKQKRR